jgi:hypothetical protein
MHSLPVSFFSNIFGIINNSRFDRAASKHFPEPKQKEALHEDFPVRHTFFQLPADECEKKYVAHLSVHLIH